MKRIILLPVLLITSLLLIYFVDSNLGYDPVPLPVQTTSTLYNEDFAEPANAAEAILLEARENLGVPSISAAVAVDGKLVWAGAVGWQDVALKTRATPETRYRIGSTSKTITATVAARLVDQGILDIDQPISEYLSEIPNDAWRSISPRQLMSHTAGLPGYTENRDWWGMYQTLSLQRFFPDVRKSLDVFDDSKLLYAPGSDFKYSSFDISLMSVVLQDAVNIKFPVLVHSEVSSALGLTDTYADKLPGAETNQAVFYELKNGEIKPWRYVDLSLKWAGGGYISTPSDLVVLGSSWLNPDYISVETREIFWTPQTMDNGQVNEQNYAKGWRVDTTEVDGLELRRRHHGGVSKGSMNWLVVYPDKRIVVDMSINARTSEFSDFSRYEKKLTTLFLPPPTLSPDA